MDKDPTTKEEFENKTALMLEVLIMDVLGLFEVVSASVDWFVLHAEKRIRFMHANNPKWRKWLESESKRIDPRSQCKVWISHWWEAYRKDPKQYRERHSVL